MSRRVQVIQNDTTDTELKDRGRRLKIHDTGIQDTGQRESRKVQDIQKDTEDTE